jgi:hypothetical protein
MSCKLMASDEDQRVSLLARIASVKGICVLLHCQPLTASAGFIITQPLASVARILCEIFPPDFL